MNAPPLVVSLGMLVSAQSVGHPFIYNLALKGAVEALGWEHRAGIARLVPDLPMIHAIPDGWSPCLAPLQLEHFAGVARPRREWQLARAVGATADSIVRYVNQEILPLQKQSGQPILYFVDFFTLAHLVPLTVAVSRIPKDRASLWLVYRMDVAYRKSARYYRYITAYLQRIFPAGGLVALSDSALLARSIGAMLHTPVHVLPIPHAADHASSHVEVPEAVAAAHARQLRVGWLPGIARIDKGVETVRRLAARTGPEAAGFALAVSASADLLAVPGGCATIAVPNDLAPQAYADWLHATDFVLLPYLAHEYAERTSGPFVEAITAGVIPVVTDGTWMAHELRQHRLDELILDFDAGDVFARIAQALASAETRRKVADMQAHYASWHTQPSFGREIERIYLEVQRKVPT